MIDKISKDGRNMPREYMDGQVTTLGCLPCSGMAKCAGLRSVTRRLRAHSCKPLHQALPHLHVDDTAHTESRHDPAYPGRRADGPVLAHGRPPVPPVGHVSSLPVSADRPVIDVQTEQVNGRAEDLHESRRGELRQRLARGVSLDLVAQPLRQHGTEQWRDVEGRKDGHAVAQRKEGERGRRDGAEGGAGGPEQLHKDLVLVDAEADVGGRGGGELGGARGDVGGRQVPDGRGRRVERVGRQIGAAVEHEDEGERF